MLRRQHAPINQATWWRGKTFQVRAMKWRPADSDQTDDAERARAGKTATASNMYRWAMVETNQRSGEFDRPTRMEPAQELGLPPAAWRQCRSWARRGLCDADLAHDSRVQSMQDRWCLLATATSPALVDRACDKLSLTTGAVERRRVVLD